MTWTLSCAHVAAFKVELTALTHKQSSTLREDSVHTSHILTTFQTQSMLMATVKTNQCPLTLRDLVAAHHKTTPE